MGKYSTTLDLLTCTLQGVDIVLGMQWLEVENPEIDWPTGRITLGCARAEGPPQTTARAVTTEVGQADGAAQPAPAKAVQLEVLTAKRWKRMMKKPASVEQMAMLVLREEEMLATAASCRAEATGSASAAAAAAGPEQDGAAAASGPPGVNKTTPAVVTKVVQRQIHPTASIGVLDRLCT